jgi:hypothetical protein
LQVTALVPVGVEVAVALVVVPVRPDQALVPAGGRCDGVQERRRLPVGRGVERRAQCLLDAEQVGERCLLGRELLDQ